MIFGAALLGKVGVLMLVGGGPTTTAMVKEFASRCGGFEAKILVLGQTHRDPKSARASVAFLKAKGFKKIQIFEQPILSPIDKHALEKAVDEAAGIWVPGGDQQLIVDRIGAEWGHKIFSKAIARGTNWFGTSAGATCVSDPMLRDETTCPGFGLINVLIDTHYRTRSREMRLKRAFFGGNYAMGIGLDEGEWVILQNNELQELHGTPKVFLKEITMHAVSR